VSSRDKTQTAVHSPPASADLPELAILVMQGSALHPESSSSRRLVMVRSGLDIGRTSSLASPSPPLAPRDEVVAGPSSDGPPASDPPASSAELGTLLLPDPLVSANHARLARVSGAGGVAGSASASAIAYRLSDLGSKNGTFVDGVRIDAPVRLRDGAVIFLGDHVAVFRLVSPRALDAIQVELTAPLGPVGTASPALALACDRLRRLAPADGELMLLGETGVGKEVYARAVHRQSGRRGRFVAINCGAIPRDLVESELFGFRAGAHSTAHAAKPGLIEEAEGGTLFLDEIGEMAPEAQIKLLRFLQDRELTPLGSTRARKIDVRVIAATNRTDDPSGKSPGGLREDILGRLAISPIHLPPLRERLEDLGALVAHFLRRAPATARTFEQAAFRALALHAWPLNVRELEKSLATAAVLTGGERPIALRDLPPGLGAAVAALGEATRRAPVAPETHPSSGSASDSAPGSASGFASGPAATPTPTPTAAQIEELLGRHQGNVAEVARALGKQRAAVWRWMKKWGIGVERFRRPD
jgi:DNA-binding NtrC family response regulator